MLEEGYFEIPNHDRYLLSKDGRVLNKETETHLEGSVNPDGYWNFRLTDDQGKVLTWGRHRLLAYVFKNPGEPIENLVVNHKNGIKGDDRLDNLEWTTHQGNIEHAGEFGLTAKCTPISVRDDTTGIVTEYPSIVECARSLGMTRDAVNYRVKSMGRVLYPEMKQYRPATEKGEWPKGLLRGVVLRYVGTDRVMSFSRLQTLANHLKVSPSTITLWLSKEGQPVLPGFIQLKWLSDPTPWREVNDPVSELAISTGKKPVRVISPTEERVFNSAIECANAMGLKPTALNHRLKSNFSKVYSDGCRYGYH